MPEPDETPLTVQEAAPAADDLIPTRYSLLSRLQNWADDESWRVFFDTYWRLIYSFALKAGLTQSEAEDVVQETVICVAQNIQKFKRDRRLGSFKGWLRNLTRWRIADQFKKRSANVANEVPKTEAMEDVPEPADEAADPRWEQEWQTHLLQTATQRVKQRVSEEQYQVFDLYVMREWPVARICETLGVNSAQVYLAKHRVARLLKKEVLRLEKEWQ